MKTNIPNNVLPVDLANPNSLTTTYTTNVMYPKLGPLAVNRYVRIIARLLKDYASSMVIAKRTRDYYDLFKVPVKVIKESDEWLRDNMTFQPMLETKDVYMSTFIANLSTFRDPEVNLNVIKTFNEVGTTIDGQATNNNHVDVTVTRPNDFLDSPIVVTDRDSKNPIGGIGDLGEVEFKLLNGRIVSNKVTSATLMHTNTSIGEVMSKSGVITASFKTVEKTKENQKRAYMLGNIMHGLSYVNATLPDMIDKKVINLQDTLLNDKILKSKDYMNDIAEALANVQLDSKRMEVVPLIDQAFYYLEQLGLENDTFVKKYSNDKKFAKNVQIYVISKMDKAKPIDNGEIPLPNDSDIINSREWAFQRTERLELILGKPVLRGPFNAESVSPNSELTIAESFTSEQFNMSETITGSSQKSSNKHGTFTSRRFQSSLNHMTENGISDENSFKSDKTLLNTLREQRREAIDQTLTSISHENEQRSMSASSISTSTSRSYTTRGKDSFFATTELAFQVSAPVQAKVFLEDVNMVWAPSVPSPFLRLHNMIYAYAKNAEKEYTYQNYIADPIRPIELYRRKSIMKEIPINGNDYYQSVEFDISIDATLRDESNAWTLDASDSTLDFRNGSSEDYNIISLNGDSLEVWSTRYKNLYQEGNRIKGEVILETTDPEWLNSGFMMLKLVLKQLTPESQKLLREYSLNQVSVEAERRAISSRARQYAKLKKDEMIAHYEQSIHLKAEAFNALIIQVFQGVRPRHYGYYKEIIHSSINWTNSNIQFEANSTTRLPYPEFSRSHFMNASGIRFILPIKRTAEDAFFEALGKNGSTYYASSAKKVREFTETYRKRVDELKKVSPETLILDDYKREIVIGRHLEAVMSKHPFKE